MRMVCDLLFKHAVLKCKIVENKPKSVSVIIRLKLTYADLQKWILNTDRERETD